MADVQDMDFFFRHGEKDSIFVLSPTVKNLPNFRLERFALRRERAAFGKSLQRTNRIVDAFEPAFGGFRLAFCQSRARFRDVLLGGKFQDDAPPPHFLRRRTLCRARISSSATRNGLPVPAFMASRPR